MKRMIIALTALILSLSLCVPVMASEMQEQEKTTHTVTFDGNGRGGVLFTIEVEDGKGIIDSINNDEDYFKLFSETEDGEKHYIVYDWYYEPECNNTVGIYSDKITENKTVYAKWIECITEVDITVDAPKAGLSTTTEKNGSGGWNFRSQTNPPVVSIKGNKCDFYGYDAGVPYTNWVNEVGFENMEPYIGKFSVGHEYNSFMTLVCDSEKYLFQRRQK